MKKILFIITLISISTMGVFAQENTEKEIKTIKNVIQTSYVEGLQNEGDIDKIDSGFHPSFRLIGIKGDNDTWEYPIEDWKKSVLKRKEAGVYPKTGENKVSIKFLDVDVTGTAATAKFEFYVGKRLAYVDYMALYKFKKGWMIVNKTYFEFPKDEK